MFLALSIIILLLFILLVINKFKIVPQYAIVLYVFSFVLGFYINDSNHYWICQALLFFVFFITSSFTFKKNIYNDSFKEYRFNYLFYYIVVGLIIYHYIAGGIPAFSDNVVVDRFDFTSSGLFGIPGRMANYGRLFILFYSLYFYNRKSIFQNYTKYDKYFYISIIINIICSLFAGTKSALISMIFVFIYLIAFWDHPVSIKLFLKPKYFVILGIMICFGIIYMQYYFNVYNSQFMNSQYSNMGFWQYVFYRLTNMSVDSGIFVLKNKDIKSITYFDEIIYYVQKYFHISLTDKKVYPLEIWASLGLDGKTYTGAYSIYTPVTIGFVAESIYHFRYFSIFFVFLFGFVYGSILKKIKKFRSPIEYASLGLVIYFMNCFIGKGNLVYNTINCFLMILIMCVIYKISKIIMNSVKI